MKTKLKNLVVVGVASFLLLGCSTMNRAPKGWEYKAVRLIPTQQNFETELNAASNGGWKLLTVVPTEAAGLSGYSQYIFQRQKP